MDENPRACAGHELGGDASDSTFAAYNAGCQKQAWEVQKEVTPTLVFTNII
jgi:hypothetical protein